MTILKRRQQITWRSLCAKAPLVAAMWALQSGVPLHAQDFQPITTADGTGIGSLRDAVIASNGSTSDDQIVLDAGTYKLTVPDITFGAIYGDLDITRSSSAGTVTIIGKGVGVTIIDANSIDRIFSIIGSKVVLKNLTLTGGVARNSGNTSGFGIYGGAIFSYGGTLTLDTVSIESCTATRSGQGYFAAGGGIYATNGGSLTLINSTLKGNKAQGSNGIDGPNGFIPSQNGSSASSGTGGAIYATGITVSISGSTISSNSALGGIGGRGGDAGTYGSYGGGTGGSGGAAQGGGIFASGGSLTISNSTVSSNTVQGGNGGGGGAGSLGAVGGAGGSSGFGSSGGGIYLSFGTPGSISNTTIAFNNAVSATGGAGGVGVPAGPAGSTTPGAGGGLAVNLILPDFAPAATRAPAPPTVVTLSSTLISNNTAANQPDSGGTITSQGYNLVGNATGSTGFTQPTDITGKDPLLAALANNGGPTFTHALKAGSPAIDKGLANGLTLDQRGTGYPRVVGAAADIGAFELEAPKPPSNPPIITSGPTATPSNPIVNQVVTFFMSGAGNVTWNFGDGSTGSGDTTTHQYAIPGTYTVIVTLTDPNTGQTVTAQMTITVHGTPFRVSRVTVKLSTGHDKVTMMGVVHIPAGLSVGGKTFILSLGTNTLTFVLDSKGKGSNSFGKLKVNQQKSTSSQEATFTAVLSGDFLAGLKVSQPLDSNGLPTQLAVGAQFAGAYYDANNLPIDPVLLFSIPVKFVNNVAKFRLLAPIKK